MANPLGNDDIYNIPQNQYHQPQLEQGETEGRVRNVTREIFRVLLLLGTVALIGSIFFSTAPVPTSYYLIMIGVIFCSAVMLQRPYQHHQFHHHHHLHQ